VKKPFLEREALIWLIVFAPAIALLIARWGTDAPLARVVGCLISTWVCTAVCGLAVHSVVNFLAPRLFSRTSRVVAILGIAAAGLATVVGTMLVLLPRLVVVDPNLAQDPTPFVLQGVAVAVLYVAGARLVTWLRQRTAESEALTLRARLAALQAQVNPHFLFNTLNAIASLIPKDPSAAESTVERLASVLQYSIASSSRGRVTLAEELAAVRDYLEIEHARFGERLRSKIEVDGAIESDAIPPMLLQPLVENAVLHGLSSRNEGGAVLVEGRAEDGAMVLRVSDDGVGPGGSKRRGNKTGLANLRERLALTYGGAARLSVGPRAGGGFECEIRVPRTS
jgi:two-component system, LytTR family, sensor histidine kinase AlgZ